MFVVRNIALGTSIFAASSRCVSASVCNSTSNSLFRQWNQSCTFTTSVDKLFPPPAPLMFESEVLGTAESKRIFFYPAGVPRVDTSRISPWHDIPLFRDIENQTLNYVNEIPKNTRPKYEIGTAEPSNPIKQDMKNGKLRNFTFGNIPFNYGALPQTWEDPSEIDPDLNLGGDNDPLDVVELSPGALTEGGIYEVKVIGLLALLDEGEVDWKILAVNVKNPLARKLNDKTDLENVLPGMEHTIREWFRDYKTTDGKPKNEFGFGERIRSRKRAMSVILHTHAAWRRLIAGDTHPGDLWMAVEKAKVKEEIKEEIREDVKKGKK